MGKKVRCPKCNTVKRVPARQQAAGDQQPVAVESQQQPARRKGESAKSMRDAGQGKPNGKRRSAEDPRPPRKKTATRSTPNGTQRAQQSAAPKKKRKVKRRKAKPSSRNREDDLFGGMDDLLAEQNDVIDEYDDENPYAAPQRQSNPRKKGRSSNGQLKVWQKLFSFNGRVKRQDFWLYILTTGALSVCLQGGALGGAAALQRIDAESVGAIAFIGLYFLSIVLHFAIAWSVYVKRLHDRGKSGVRVFGIIAALFVTAVVFELSGRHAFVAIVYAIPLLAALWLFIECGFFAGTTGPNEYGPEPR